VTNPTILAVLLLILAIVMSFFVGRLVGRQDRLSYKSPTPLPSSNVDHAPTEPMPLKSDINIPPEKMPVAYLMGMDHPIKDKPYDLDKPIIKLGRTADQADIVFGWDKKLSRLQGQIEYRDGDFYLWDFSTNGTFVNGKRLFSSEPKNLLLEQATLLENGAEIKMGERVRLMFHSKYISPTDPLDSNK
jgi:hypothetical protein